MNYIKRLEEGNRELTTLRCELVDLISDKMAYLASDKFQGPDNNFVNAREMFTFLAELRIKL
jgi:hypothetical protein